MSKLEFFARPLVAFDPNNKDHRRWYHEFLEYRGWGKCPVRFVCPESTGHDLTIMIRNQLIEYYVHKEFGSQPSTLDAVLRQKKKKTVDKGPKV
jgi:hypothetical protein